MEHSVLKHPKVVPRKELAHRSQLLRAEGERLVLTNGCFDLLHVGHVRYLCHARALGDRLIVGINSDKSVRRLKGPGRPITPQDDRAEMLAALHSVNFVTIFDEDSATSLVEEIQPDIYVKGGDYSNDPDDPTWPAEGTTVRAYGGDVRMMKYVRGYSTASLLKRIREACET